jgi:hypothetical protein
MSRYGEVFWRARTPALRRAVEFGVDVTLLLENLKYSPTERVRRAQRSLDSMVAFQAEASAWRQRHDRRP